MSNQENDDAGLPPNDRRAIRSFRKLIDAHEKKLEEFLSRPTVRPGMEGLASDLVRSQQEARAKRLIREIRKFEKEIALRRRKEGRTMNSCELRMFLDGALPDWAALGTARTICLMDSTYQLEELVLNAVDAGAFAFVCCGELAEQVEDSIDEVLEQSEDMFDIMTTAHNGETADDIAFFIAVALGGNEFFRVLAFVQSADEQALAVCAALKGYVAVPA